MEEKKAENVTEVFIEKTVDVIMGELLDAGRMSDMGDRQFSQFERTIKNKFNNFKKLYKEKLILKEEVKGE
jgi:hypothetical protein